MGGGCSSIQNSFEAFIGRVQVELHFSRLLWAQVFGGTHLVQRYQPAHYFALILEVAVGDPVYRLDGVDQDRVQCILGQNVHPDRIEQGDEVLGCGYNG